MPQANFPEMTKVRDPWIDNVKAFAILCVIIGHSIGLLADKPNSMQLAGSWIVAFNMPLFVLMAGWTAQRGFERIVNWSSLLVFFEKLVERLVIPSVVFSALYPIARGEFLSRHLWLIYFSLIVIYYLSKRIKDVIPGRWLFPIRAFLVAALVVLSFPINYYWFLIMIIQYQIILGLISFIFQKLNWSGIWDLGIRLAVFCLIVLAFCSSWTKEFVFYCVLGLLFHKLELKNTFTMLPSWLFVIALILIIPSVQYVSDYDFYQHGVSSLVLNGKWWIFLLRQMNGIILSLVIIRCVIALSKRYNEISRFGSFSMALYMLHTQILAIYPISFEGSSTYKGWLYLLVIVCVWTAISYGIILCLNKWFLPRKLFLGKD